MTEIQHEITIKMSQDMNRRLYLYTAKCSCNQWSSFAKMTPKEAADQGLEHIEDFSTIAARSQQSEVLQKTINRAKFLAYASVTGVPYNSTWYVNLELYQMLEKKAKEITTNFLYIRETGISEDVMLYGIPVRIRPSVTKLTLECWAQ